MDQMPALLWESVVLRPYVFLFLGAYLVSAAAEWGWRRAVGFVVWAGGLAFVAEWSSTRVGLPFGLYHYTGATRGQELYLANVPFFDPLSFTFLAYASLGVARFLLAGRSPGGPLAARVALAATVGFLMMWLDVVIDPLAVRGDRWLLGRIFYYPDPGWYFGVPVANFVGWAVLGASIALGWPTLARWLGGAPPAWGAWLPPPTVRAVGLYYLILTFNLIMTVLVAETSLFWSGLGVHLPLLALVVSSWGSRPRG